MPSYRVFRLKDNFRQQFRSSPHLSGVTAVKPKDYDESFSVEASTPYSAWQSLRGTETALGPGDLLQAVDGDLRILKYIGFEEARWVLPEPKAPLPENHAGPETSDENAPIGFG